MAKDKKGLGRGLSSLLGSAELPSNNVSRETKETDIKDPIKGGDPQTSLTNAPYAQDDRNNKERLSINPEDAPVIIRDENKEIKEFISESNFNDYSNGGDPSTSHADAPYAQDNNSKSHYEKKHEILESNNLQHVQENNVNVEDLQTTLNDAPYAQDDRKNNEISTNNSTTTSNFTNSVEVGDLSTSSRRDFAQDDKKDNIDNNVSRETNENYLKLKIDDIEPNPDQPRRTFDEQKLQELAHSIKDQGVLQPIVVRKKDDKYQIIAGERRWQAARIAGLKEVPCILQEANDDKALELALIENIQRDDLNPIEEAYTYKRLMDKLNYTQAELAKAVAKGRSTIANAIRLLDLPEQAQEAMFNEKLTAGHARAVLSVPSPKGRIKLTEKIIEDNLSVREAESLARLLSVNTTSGVRNNKNNVPSAYTAIAKSLKEVLGTQVRIKKTKSGSKLEISFSNEEELRSIYEKLAEE